MNILVVTPAYGKDYKSIAEVMAAWNNNEDFVINSLSPSIGNYISINTLREHPGSITHLEFRYKGEKKLLFRKLDSKKRVRA